MNYINDNKLSVTDLFFNTFVNILRAEKKMLSNSEYNDLSPKDLHLIHLIGKMGTITVSNLASSVGTTKSTITKSINILFKRGYVIRRRNLSDRRYVYISLSKKGITLFNINDKFHDQIINKLLEEFNEREKEKFKNGILSINTELLNYI